MPRKRRHSVINSDSSDSGSVKPPRKMQRIRRSSRIKRKPNKLIDEILSKNKSVNEDNDEDTFSIEDTLSNDSEIQIEFNDQDDVSDFGIIPADAIENEIENVLKGKTSMVTTDKQGASERMMLGKLIGNKKYNKAINSLQKRILDTQIKFGDIIDLDVNDEEIADLILRFMDSKLKGMASPIIMQTMESKIKMIVQNLKNEDTKKFQELDIDIQEIYDLKVPPSIMEKLLKKYVEFTNIKHDGVPFNMKLNEWSSLRSLIDNYSKLTSEQLKEVSNVTETSSLTIAFISDLNMYPAVKSKAISLYELCNDTSGPEFLRVNHRQELLKLIKKNTIGDYTKIKNKEDFLELNNATKLEYWKARGLKSQVYQTLRDEIEFHNVEEHHNSSEKLDTILNLCLVPSKNQPSDNHVSVIMKAQKLLNRKVYGLTKTKTAILENLNEELSSSNHQKKPLLLIGKPGVGKTRLARCVAEATGRRMIYLSMNGIKDKVDIIGHSSTYVNSHPGMVIKQFDFDDEVVIVIDEIDKTTRDIQNLWLSAIDPSQNFEFTDVFVGIPISLINAQFIFTANYKNKIPAPFLDRMEVEEISDYSFKEKVEIIFNHSFPEALLRSSFKEGDITFTKGVIAHIISIINNEKTTIRDIETNIDIIIRRLSLLRTGIDVEYKIKDLEFPCKLTEDIVNILLKDKYGSIDSWLSMYA